MARLMQQARGALNNAMRYYHLDLEGETVKQEDKSYIYWEYREQLMTRIMALRGSVSVTSVRRG